MSILQTQIHDTTMMRRAIELAVLGRGNVSPNPLVGCVITDGAQIIGEGYHQKYGEAHAEANAMDDCLKKGFSPIGATVYVTLEPCAHFGKRSPCADLLIEQKIARCVIAVTDPYKEVNGKGIAKLRDAGIEVALGVLEPEAREMNKFFLTSIETGLPYVTMKIASSLDGKVALKSGVSKYITSEASRREVHQLRASFDSVLVASATVLADDPELTVRLCDGRSPKRIILDASLRVAETARVYSDDHCASTIIISNESAIKDKRQKMQELESRGITIIGFKSSTEQLDLESVFRELCSRGISSILVEPGPTLATTIYQNGLFNEVLLFLAPTILGDDARSAFGELHLRSLSLAGQLRLAECRHVEGSDDIFLSYRK